MTLADFGLTEASVTILVFLYIFLFLLISFGAAVFFYLKGFGIYKMSRKLKIKRSWYGFLPFFNVYALGRIADSADNKKSGYRKSLIALYAISVIISVVGAVLAVVFTVKLFFAADTAVFEGKELDSEIFGGLLPSVVVLLVSAVFRLVYHILKCVCAKKAFKLFGAGCPTAKAILGFFIPILLPLFLYSACKGEPNESESSLKHDDSVIFSINE